jgi:transposase
MWTTENRGRYHRSRLRYPSDLTDAEWALIALVIPRARRGGGERTFDLREVIPADVCAQHRLPVARALLITSGKIV